MKLLAIAGALPYFGYALDEGNEAEAIIQALLNDDYAIERRKQDTHVSVHEVSDDWELDGMGTIRAKELKKVFVGRIPLKLHQSLIETCKAIEDKVDELRFTKENQELVE
jgi:hypothetical protein